MTDHNPCPVTGFDCITCDGGQCKLADKQAQNARILDAFDALGRNMERAAREKRTEVERAARKKW